MIRPRRLSRRTPVIPARLAIRSGVDEVLVDLVPGTGTASLQAPVNDQSVVVTMPYTIAPCDASGVHTVTLGGSNVFVAYRSAFGHCLVPVDLGADTDGLAAGRGTVVGRFTIPLTLSVLPPDRRPT